MRYQKEIEGILRILHVFDSRTKDKYDVLNNLNWEGNTKNNELAYLIGIAHKLKLNFIKNSKFQHG